MTPKELTKAEKLELIASYSSRHPTVIADMRAAGFDTSIDVKTISGELILGADIHFVVEHKNPDDDFGWVGSYSTGSPVSVTPYSDGFLNSAQDTTHALGKLKRRDYAFFTNLAGVRGEGPDPKGIPADASPTTMRQAKYWDGDGHSHSYMSLREFVLTKLISGEGISKAAKSKLDGDDPIAEFLGPDFCEHNEFFCLTDNTRVVFWFDN